AGATQRAGDHGVAHTGLAVRHDRAAVGQLVQVPEHAAAAEVLRAGDVAVVVLGPVAHVEQHRGVDGVEPGRRDDGGRGQGEPVEVGREADHRVDADADQVVTHRLGELLVRG